MKDLLLKIVPDALVVGLLAGIAVGLASVLYCSL